MGIEKEAFLPLLDEFGLTTDCTMAELAKHESVQKLISEEIDKINQGLAQFESIKKFKIVPEEFSLENFLTPSLKVKRKLVAERYADLIEAMYQ